MTVDNRKTGLSGMSFVAALIHYIPAMRCTSYLPTIPIWIPDISFRKYLTVCSISDRHTLPCCADRNPTVEEIRAL